MMLNQFLTALNTNLIHTKAGTQLCWEVSVFVKYGLVKKILNESVEKCQMQILPHW